MSQEEYDKHVEADEQDKAWEEKKAKMKEEFNKTSLFSKLWVYNDPKWYFPIGVIGTLMSGVVFPLYSVQFSDAIGILAIPVNILPYTRPEEKDNI